MFASMDMTENFYYSYSYDLTNTLQHNLATPKLVRGRGTVVRNWERRINLPIFT